MQQFLVIGATGVMGTAAIQAIRALHGADARVCGVWYGREDNLQEIDGVDALLFADIGDPATFDAIATRFGTRFDWCFFATALGDVGFPVAEATAEQVAAANRLSFDPLPRLEERFEIGTLVAYSTFYNL
ncbi:MAG TPA: hypothetical protein VIW02_07635, partial [Gammaproteobacteria bacterium]